MRLKPTTSYIRSFVWVFLALFLGAGKAAALPQPAHIVIVIEENHDFTQIIGTSQAVTAPYWNSLANAGALMTNSHGYSHNSEDNYMALFDGDPYDGTGPSALNYGTDGDTYPLPVSMASNANLANSLILGGYTFAGYSEDIPSAGSTVATATGSVAGHTSSGFAAKHNPWLDFQVGHGAFGNIPATCNQPMTTFQGISDYSTLPTVSIVVPDLWNDIHDGPVSVGDQWMQTNLGNYATYCQNPANNSLLILTWDENVAGNDTDSNRIPTVFYGSMVTPGSYAESINHYNVLKTLLTMYNLSPIGAATSASVTVISDIFQPANTSTSTPTATSTNTPTLTFTPSATGTNSFTSTITNTTTDSATNTPTTTDTPTMTGTLTIATTSTATNSATNSSTNSSTNTATNTATTTSTNTATNTSSATSTSTVSSTFSSTSSFTATATVCLPRPDHIVILIDSDEPYANVLGASQSVTAPYFNSLAATGAVLTNYNGLSTGGAEPNWIGLFSGQTKVTGDTCPTGPYTDANLASELIAGGFSFSGYSEGIPSAGSTVCSSGTGNAMYVAKHAPWVFFSNLNQTTVGQSFTAFQGISDYSTLPSVSIVVPNEADDIRLGTAGASSITEGDTWAKTNLDAYYKWAMGHNSLFIVMFDYVGSSSVGPVPMIINGPMVVPGSYSTSANHYNLLATLEDMYGIPLTGGAVTATAMTQMFNCTGTFPTVTNTPTLNTPTFTNTGTGTFTSTAVNTSTATATSTFTNSFTNTVVNTTTDTPSSTATNTPVSTDTLSSTATNTFTNTSATTDTATNTATSTLTNTLTPTITPTATMTNTPIGGLAPGSIAFTGLLGNGDNQISFVPLTTISAGTTIFFTNEAWDNTANSGSGGLVDKTGLIVTGSTEDDSIIQYVATSGLSAYNQVIIGKTSGTTQINQLFGGSVAYVSGAGSTSASPWLVMNNTVKGNKVLAFTSTLSAPSTTNVNSSNVSFLTAAIFGPDSWTTSGSPVNAYDTYLPPALDATTSSDLSSLWNSSATFTAQAAGGQDNAVQSNPSSTLAGLVNPYNWSGNVSTKTGFRLNQPVSVTAPSAGQGGWNVADSVEVFNFTPTSTLTNTAVNTSTATATLTNTVVNTATNTSTNSSTNTSTSTATNTSTNSATNTATNTSTNTVSGATDTATNTATSTFSSTWTNTPVNTNTATNTATNTVTNTLTSTSANTATSTWTNTSTSTAGGSTDTATNTATNTFSSTWTNTPVNTNTATNTATSTSTSANTATSTWTNTSTSTAGGATDTPTNTSTNTFSSTLTNTPVNTSTVTNTFTNTVANTLTNTPVTTSTFTSTSTLTFTNTASGNTSTATNTITPTATATTGSLAAGSIAFTGVLMNGNSSFGFVSTTNLNAGQVIYFTNESYDATIPGLVAESAAVGATPVTVVDGNFGGVTIVQSGATTITEGVISYTVGAGGLAAYQQVVIGATGSSLQGGTNSGTLTLNHNGTGHKLIAFTASGPATQYVAAVMFGPNSWQTSGSIGTNAFWDSYLPPGLDVTTSTDLSTLWNNGNLNQFNTAATQNDNFVVSCQTTLSGIVSPFNWSGDGNESKTKVEIGSSLVGVTACSANSAGWTGLASAITNGAATYTPTVSAPTNTATAALSSTFTSTPTSSLTSPSTVTNTATATFTNSSTATVTNTTTDTATSTITNTPQATNTATNTTTATPTNTGTVTPLTATNTATNTSTASFISTPTFTNTVTNSPTVTSTVTNTATSTFTNTATSTYTNTITNTPQATSTPTNSVTVTSTATTTPTSTFTSTTTATPSFTATSTGTLGTPTSTTTFTPTLTKTTTPTVTPTATTAPIEVAQKVVVGNQSASCDLSNGAGVQVPAGVFSAGTTLTVMEFAPSTAPPASSGFQTILGNIYTFDASSGNTDNFSTPVTMTFPVSASVLDKYSDQQLQVAYYNAATQRWQTLNTIVDRHRDVLTVVTNHFSMWTVVADAFLSSSTAGGGNILAPVPANSGDSVCLYTAQSVASSTWSIYSVTGYHVATVSYSNSEGSQCWNTQGVGRGLYYVKLVLTYVGGTSVTEWHKVVVK